MKDIYVDIRNDYVMQEVFKGKDFVSIEDLLDTIDSLMGDLDEKNKKIKELSEFKDNMCNEIDDNPYSYYGVNENDF